MIEDLLVVENIQLCTINNDCFNFSGAHMQKAGELMSLLVILECYLYMNFGLIGMP